MPPCCIIAIPGEIIKIFQGASDFSSADYKKKNISNIIYFSIKELIFPISEHIKNICTTLEANLKIQLYIRLIHVCVCVYIYIYIYIPRHSLLYSMLWFYYNIFFIFSHYFYTSIVLFNLYQHFIKSLY